MTENLTGDTGLWLLQTARQVIRGELEKKGRIDTDKLIPEAPDPVIKENRGVFVTLHKNSELRGCIGNIEPVKSIFDGVVDNAKNAAFRDSRFHPLTAAELEDVTIEVSILTRPEKIEYTDYQDLIKKIRPGIDGVMIRKNHQGATFLPQVWEQLKEPEAFFSHLSMKAGFSADEWKAGSLEVLTYQVQKFEEGT
jgi:uncharacterized protein